MQVCARYPFLDCSICMSLVKCGYVFVLVGGAREGRGSVHMWKRSNFQQWERLFPVCLV